MKYVVCLLLAVAAIAYAASDATIFGPGVEGFLKTKSPTAAWYNTNIAGNAWVVFYRW